jgi:hypothetical protein
MVTTLSETLAEFSDEVDTRVTFGRFNREHEYTGNGLDQRAVTRSTRARHLGSRQRCQIR